MLIYRSLKINVFNVLSLMLLLIELVIKPIFKYYEYHHDGFRLNFSIVSSMIALLFAVQIILNLVSKKIKFNKNIQYSLPIIIFICIYFIVLVNYPFISSLPIFRIKIFYLEYFSMIVVSSFLYYVLGFFILDIVKKRPFRICLLFSWIAYTTIIFMNTGFESSFLKSTLEIDVTNPNYIMLSDAYALLSILIIPFTKRLSSRLFIFIISSMALYFLMSRASLYTFILLNFIVLVLINHKLIWLTIVLILTSFIFIDWEFFTRINSNNRMFRLITFGNDLSKNSRNMIFESGLKSIYENWFFGQFMGDVISRKNTGTYIHNIFSIWRQFGLLIFILVIFNIFYIYIKFALSSFKDFKWDAKQQFVFILSMYCLILFVFARSFLFAEFWLVFSLIPSYLSKKSKSNFND